MKHFLQKSLSLKTLLVCLLIGTASGAWADTFVRVTSTDALEYGAQYILVAESKDKAMGSIGTYGAAVDVTITNNTIELTNDLNVLTLSGSSSGGWMFTTSKESKKLSWTSQNSLALTTNDYKWTISFTGNNVFIKSKDTQARVIRYNASSPRFACYTSAQTDIQLYKKAASKADAELSFATTTYNAVLSQGFNAPALTNPHSLDVTYSSSNENVATVDETSGAVALVGAGTTIITASSAETEDYQAGSASYTLNVSAKVKEEAGIAFSAASATKDMEGDEELPSFSNPNDLSVAFESSNTDVATVDENTGAVTLVGEGVATISATFAGNDDYFESTVSYELTVTYVNKPGTVNRPYTVAEAIAATPASGTSENVYISGIVSSFYGSDIVSDGSNYRYYISDDGTTDTELLVYKGKGLNQVAFSSADDLLIGDRVVIVGGLTIFKGASEVAANNYLYSHITKSASDLAKTSDIELDVKGSDLLADIADYISSSSTGAYTYSDYDENIVTVESDGTVTGLKEGSTTITVSQAADANYKAGEVTVAVTIADTRANATTIPAINISTLKVGAAEGTIAVVDPVKADAGVTFSFTSDNEDVLLIDGTDYIVGEVGTAEVTVTATASDATLYKNVTATFTVTVEAATKAETEILLDEESGNTPYGTPLAVEYVLTTGYDGELTYEIANSAIADVAIGAGAITFTPKAVGTTTITFSADATATYNAAEDVVYTLTVNAPVGGTTAAVSSVTLFEETFNNTEGSGGRDAVFTGSVGTGSVTSDEAWETISNNGAYQCIKLGTSKAAGSVTTSEIALTGNGTLTFAAAGWGDTNANTVKVTADGATLSGDVNVTLTNGDWSTYTVNITEATGSVSLTFTMKRGFLDDVKVESAGAAISATLNANGFASYCSEYPLDFSESLEAGYSAWQVTDIEGSTITFDRVKGAVKGGTGLILKGEADATVNLTSVDSSNDLTTNFLEGTLAPTYVAAGTYYGLKGDNFQSINGGVVKAGKAILDATLLDASVKNFTLVFNEETGVRSVVTLSASEAAQLFDLNGRRQTKVQKGINIVNGKKVIVK